MNKKIITLGVVLLLVVVGGIWMLAGNSRNQTEQENRNNQAQLIDASVPQNPQPSVSVTMYTLSQVAEHSTAESCWSAVKGNVYDLTSWTSKHPGGAKAILMLCGKDGSEAFSIKHGGMEKPEAVLARFKIGVLD